MSNINNLKKFIKKYSITKDEKDAKILILSLSYNYPGLNVYMLLSKEERNIIKDACDCLKPNEIEKVI